MAKIGMPTLKLKSGYGKGKHAGNARAVALEALEERFCSDEDLNKSKTKFNVYQGQFRSGEALANYWEEQADNYRIIDKNGNAKKLRSDASIGFALIAKPDSAYVMDMNEQQRARFMTALYAVTKEVLERRGLTVDASVLHKDEISDHWHIFGHDKDYQLGKKLNLSFFKALNREVPKRMRQLGWKDVEDCIAYDDEAVKKMTDTAAVTYKEQHKAAKKKRQHGKSSAAFKAEKRLEDKKAAFQAQVNEEREYRISQKRSIRESKTKLADDRKALEAEQKQLKEDRAKLTTKQNSIIARETALIRSESDLDKERKEFAKKQLKAVTEQNRAISEGIEKGVEAAKAAYEANKKANDKVVKQLREEVAKQINAIQRVPGRRAPEGIEQLQKKLDDYQMGN